MDFLILAFRALKERKLRSALTVLMVIIGASLLVSINGLSNGTKDFVNKEFYKFGTNMIVVTRRGGDFEIKDWFVDELKKIDGVEEVIPLIQTYAQIYYQGEYRTVFVTGIEQSKLHYIYRGLDVEEGSLVPESDLSGVVLGNQIANSFDPPARVGTSIQIIYKYTDEEGNEQYKKKSFSIRGILEYFGSYVSPVDQVVFMSLKAADRFFMRNGKYDGVYVITKDADLNDEIADYISSKWDVDTLTPQSVKESVDRILNTLNFFIASISFVSLMVAAIGIVTTLYTSMLERIREIGVLRAIGFKKRHILKMFLYEASVIGMLGSSIGLGAGVVLAYIMKEIFFASLPFIYPIFDAITMIQVWLMGVGLSIVAGLYPSWRASKVDPIVALKYE